MQELYLNLIPGSIPPVCKASQNDVGRTIRFNLVDGFIPKVLSGTEEIKLRARKPDGSIHTSYITNTSEAYLDVTTSEDLTNIAGNVYCKIWIGSVCMQAFIMKVENQP